MRSEEGWSEAKTNLTNNQTLTSMDKLTDFLDEIKIRLRNPFFASFVLSWFVWNWRIWVGLLWLDSNSLIKSGHSNYVSYIEGQIFFGKGFFYPLLSAILVVLALPVIRNWIEMYQAWTLNWGEKAVLRISKTGVIPIEKYIEKKDQFLASLEEIKRAASEETILIEENKSLKLQYENALNNHKAVEEKLNNLTKDVSTSISVDSLLGSWTSKPGLDGNEQMILHISQDSIYHVTGVNKSDKYAKILFCINFRGQVNLCFKTNNRTIQFIQLTIANDKRMIGRLNDTSEIQWERY